MRYVFVLMILFSQLSSNGQLPATPKPLELAVTQFNQLNKTGAYQQVYLQFEQLYASDKANWVIPYYASLVKARMCLLKMGDRDQLATEAIQWIDRAKSIQLNDEIFCAESMAYTAKMSVSPAMRWLVYEDRIKKPLQQAKKINPSNPRVYLLEANIQKNLPSLFGGGCKATKPLIQKAEQYLNAQIVSSVVHPSWGRQSLVELKKACPY